MLVRVDDIKEDGLVLDFEENPSVFPILAETDEAKFSAPVRAHLRLIRVDEMVEVEGRVETVVGLACSRCLKEFDRPLEARFALTFVRELPESIEEPEEEEVEISAEEMGLIPFQGDEIDLLEPIQEQLIMAIPYRPLCDLACKGLCPNCGADLNEAECGCEPPVFNSRFGVLKDFKPEKE
ncbi:MAG: DUF177 domain-containing protein [Desulfuromonadales bacterium]